ncbi:hypothetical protein RM530_03565 [Algiphilus sp. W345]|uniref:Phytanoyl-CoA dioxygenase n=1 Tax=Banduia mediterranea TaxID=3075609 RepID=A0ABU2WEZ8_9GAMM|nr:hypothetical protein [Algiphilus sp. W345]MDT0496443.1 hypothetical protein [Algiphilus sp. W345]
MRLPAFVRRFHKPERDAQRAQQIWRTFDEQRHYDAYLARCRAACRRVPKPEGAPELGQRGFHYLRALTPEAARARIEALQSGHQLQLLKKDSRHLEGFRVDDREWLTGFLDQVLRDPVDSAIAGFFGSEYLVHWVAFSLTRAAPEQESVSFRWHCDKGPSAHLKLIVYLNPTTGHGGNTEFMDLDDTLTVAQRGYLFGRSKARTADTRHLAELAGRPLSTELRDRQAGEAVLFQPARVLHRGISPSRGPRLTATLCLLPSPVNWRRALEAGALADLAVDDKWHDDALDFLAGLERRLKGAAQDV